jgi:ribosomal peptide maturation radical SAM protein 1
VFGGGNCDGPMGAALHRVFPWIDVVVRGEAERILPDLVRDLLVGGEIRPRPGLCYRDGERSVAVPQAGAATVAMDEIPTPQFDEYFERLAKTGFTAEVMREVRLPYETSRGCWWGAKSHCTFCGLNGSTMAFRSKSDDRVVEELTALARHHERVDFTLVDTTLDMRYFRDVLPRLRESGHDLSLYYETKSNLRREQVRLLREAGVDFLQPGIESLSTPILKLMRKGVTALQNVRLLKWCAEYGIQVYWNVIYGFPGEPPRSTRAWPLWRLRSRTWCRLSSAGWRSTASARITSVPPSSGSRRPARCPGTASSTRWTTPRSPTSPTTPTTGMPTAGTPRSTWVPCVRPSRPGRRRMPRGAIAPFAIVAVLASS